MIKHSARLAGASILAATFVMSQSADAHGVVGSRFFPATIASDDPFAADELALPTISLGNREEDFEFEYSKTIVPHFAVSFGGGIVNAHAPDETRATGFSNFEITPTWQFMTDADSEFVASAAMSFEIGGSGASAVAEKFTTYTPKILFGKGFGGLPESMALLRPFAVTGVVGYAIPGAGTEQRSIEWSGALEYSLLYLQNNVREQGYSDFVAHLTPVIEFNMTTPTGSGERETTGTINPGLIWSGQKVQLAAQAVVPVNSASGDTIGVAMQLHFYMDDIFPHSLGTPLFGGRP